MRKQIGFPRAGAKATCGASAPAVVLVHDLVYEAAHAWREVQALERLEAAIPSLRAEAALRAMRAMVAADAAQVGA